MDFPALELRSHSARAALPQPPPAADPAPKRARIRTRWLRVAADGRVEELHADRHAVAERCAIPLRDLRILDADVVKSCVALHTVASRSRLRASFSTAVLSRERAIVLNLEQVKARGAARARRRGLSGAGHHLLRRRTAAQRGQSRSRRVRRRARRAAERRRGGRQRLLRRRL